LRGEIHENENRGYGVGLCGGILPGGRAGIRLHRLQPERRLLAHRYARAFSGVTLSFHNDKWWDTHSHNTRYHWHDADTGHDWHHGYWSHGTWHAT